MIRKEHQNRTFKTKETMRNKNKSIKSNKNERKYSTRTVTEKINFRKCTETRRFSDKQITEGYN